MKDVDINTTKEKNSKLQRKKEEKKKCDAIMHMPLRKMRRECDLGDTFTSVDGIDLRSSTLPFVKRLLYQSTDSLLVIPLPPSMGNNYRLQL